MIEFEIIHWKKDDAGPETFQISSHVKTEEEAKKIIQNIKELESQNQQYKKVIDEIKELLDKESDLDLHPEAEELKTSLEIKRVLDSLKKLLSKLEEKK